MALPDLQEPLARLEEKDLDGAVRVLEQMVTALPAHLTAHVLLARAYEAQHEWDDALRSWENARFLMPNSPIVEDGKRRVLRRMDAPNDDSTRSMEALDPNQHGPSAPTGAPEEDEADDAGTDAMTGEEDPESTNPPSELAQLRRQAEREARRGGARPSLSDEGPSLGSSPPEEPLSTPEDQVEQLEAEGTADELDDLIQKLESARIEPDPDEADAPAPDLEDEAEEVVSETLARIHESQSNFEEAARIYTKLAAQEPERADEFREKADAMREKAETSEE